jgi:hypothetical protein
VLHFTGKFYHSFLEKGIEVYIKMEEKEIACADVKYHLCFWICFMLYTFGERNC